MSVRFSVNFSVLILGAALAVFAVGLPVSAAGWIGVGVGATSIVLALGSFAAADQGAAQRIADLAIVTLGAWAIVAARVMAHPGRWLEFSAATGLVALGAFGLVVREIELGRGLRVGDSRIGPDQFAHISSIQRNAKARS
jgi:hypothetical protein